VGELVPEMLADRVSEREAVKRRLVETEPDMDGE